MNKIQDQPRPGDRLHETEQAEARLLAEQLDEGVPGAIASGFAEAFTGGPISGVRQFVGVGPQGGEGMVGAPAAAMDEREQEEAWLAAEGDRLFRVRGHRPEVSVHVGDHVKAAQWAADRKGGASAPAETVLDEASRIVGGDREAAYGKPERNLGKIAAMWAAYLDHPVTARDVAQMMVLVKVSRDSHRAKRDNLVDQAGYTLLAEILADTVSEGQA